MPKEYPNFESLVSGFLSKLELATKTDVQSLMDRIDQLEQMILSVAGESEKQSLLQSNAMSHQSISDQVVEILKQNNEPMTYAELKQTSGLDEKPLRNVIYRLNKLGRIETVKRGLYAIPQEKDNNE